jgi:hypothetical protein
MELASRPKGVVLDADTATAFAQELLHVRRHPPIHNGKVWIGIAYVPKPQRIEGQDAIQLQSALLEPRTKREPSVFAKVFGRVLQWL